MRLKDAIDWLWQNCVIDVLKFIGELFETYKFARRLLLIWAMALITLVVITVLDNMASVTSPVADFLKVVVGLLTVVLAFYQWSRERDGP